ncbi:trypsin-like serine peptidase [Rhodococcus rhodnii]|uniref:trypsin-like serine peptidase n=1 Tax=Rhodococcus rhodnii TaxID=38312 RepID=UPI0009FB6B8E|nr:trypsin-like serine protease [Rhodococcus rhodnii]
MSNSGRFAHRVWAATLLALSLITVGTTAHAAPPQNLPIDPVGYRIVDDTMDISNPLPGDGLSDDVGYSRTDSSNGSARSPRSIIGPDDRTSVTDTRFAPYRRTGEITFSFGTPAQTATCTGWLISPSTVVTAGHCLTDGTDLSSHITFTPARNGTQTGPYGTYRASTVWFDSKYGAPGRDWGVIELDGPAGNDVGWYGLEPVTAADLVGQPARIIGYPTDQAPGTMWQDNAPIVRQTDRTLRYTTDTYSGQSGASVTITDEDTANAIHNGGGLANSGTILTAELFNTLARLRS